MKEQQHGAIFTAYKLETLLHSGRLVANIPESINFFQVCFYSKNDSLRFATLYVPYI